MANRYSIFSLLKESLRGHRGWAPAWRDPEPRPAYDFIVVGGGGHGLATAYYLAKSHGARNVAVLEKGYIGGGNVGRKGLHHLMYFSRSAIRFFNRWGWRFC